MARILTSIACYEAYSTPCSEAQKFSLCFSVTQTITVRLVILGKDSHQSRSILDVSGFLGDGISCFPVRSCRSDPNVCHSEAICLPTGQCMCKHGFRGNGYDCSKSECLRSGSTSLRMKFGGDKRLSAAVPAFSTETLVTQCVS